MITGSLELIHSVPIAHRTKQSPFVSLHGRVLTQALAVSRRQRGEVSIPNGRPAAVCANWLPGLAIAAPGTGHCSDHQEILPADGAVAGSVAIHD